MKIGLIRAIWNFRNQGGKKILTFFNFFFLVFLRFYFSELMYGLTKRAWNIILMGTSRNFFERRSTSASCGIKIEYGSKMNLQERNFNFGKIADFLRKKLNFWIEIFPQKISFLPNSVLHYSKPSSKLFQKNEQLRKISNFTVKEMLTILIFRE